MSRISISELRNRVAERTKGWLPIGEWGPVCHGCGADEFRIDGYCSCECRDYHSDEDFDDVVALVEIAEAARLVFDDLSATAVPRQYREELGAALARFDFGDDRAD